MTDHEIGALARSLMQAPLVWGQRDCALDAADVWKAVTGRDPMADLRGRYDTRHGYMRLAMAEGGLLNMARNRMAGEAPFTGNGAGLIRWGKQQLFAVALRGVFVARGECGMRNVSGGEILGAWSW